MNGVKETMMFSAQRSPLIIEPASGQLDLAGFVTENRASIAERLLEHGALLFRRFAVRELADFDRYVSAVTPERLDYVYGSTPRTSLGDRIFTATEYPPQLEIPLHNENSYQREWPLKISLCCLVPATSGGETPIADMRRVTAKIGTEIMEKFQQRCVRYVRHYRPFVDVPWQKVFQTDDPAAVGRFCAEHDIGYQWLDKETLRTVQICQGTACHPETGERVFFNQAHLFHISNLGEAGAKSMISLFGADKLPRQTFYGDGSDIPGDELAVIRAAFAESSLIFPWLAGDVILLDNMQFAHGRRPFKGARRVVAALMETHRHATESLAAAASKTEPLSAA